MSFHVYINKLLGIMLRRFSLTWDSVEHPAPESLPSSLAFRSASSFFNLSFSALLNFGDFALPPFFGGCNGKCLNGHVRYRRGRRII